jgi:galactonate dehydratase
MKITNVEAWVVVPDLGGPSDIYGEWQWTFVTIETDEGITGWGESSSTPRNGSLLTGAGVRAVREALIGEDPADIERLWHKLFRRYTYMGSRGFPTTIISGIDIALWDIKGKAPSMIYSVAKCEMIFVCTRMRGSGVARLLMSTPLLQSAQLRKAMML